MASTMDQVASGEARELEADEALTAESLFRRRALQHPDMLALADPPNRARLGLGRSRHYRYGAADAVVDALAHFFMELGLEPGDRIALQLPNLSEQPLSILAAWRAGLCAVMLPMLWRRSEIAPACTLLRPKALLGVGRFAGESGTETLCEIAAGEMSVRFVLGFGSDLPDGVTPLDAVIDDARRDRVKPVEARLGGEDAMITFTARRNTPLVPVVRSEDELLAQGAMTVLALSFATSDVILNPYPLTTPAGLALAMMPWLISGCTLVQHQPFDYPDFVQQLLEWSVTVTALPSPALAKLAADGVLARPDCRVKRIGCVWSPPQLAGELPELGAEGIIPFDVYPIGDLAGIVRPRDGGTDPQLLPHGQIALGEQGGTLLVETGLSGDAGGGRQELLLRGPIVPEGMTDGPLAPDQHGFVATGLYVQREEGEHLRIGDDTELLHHGGCLIAASELDALYQEFSGFLDAACFSLPDPVIGDRIFAAVVPAPGELVSLDALHTFLRVREVAPYKYPDKLLVVREIPRDAERRVLRDQILKQV